MTKRCAKLLPPEREIGGSARLVPDTARSAADVFKACWLAGRLDLEVPPNAPGRGGGGVRVPPLVRSITSGTLRSVVRLLDLRRRFS